MTPKEIGERLTSIHTSLVEKIGGQPCLSPSIVICSNGVCDLSLRGIEYADRLWNGRYTSIHDLLDAADAFIATMPDADEIAKRKFQKNLGAVIDEGNSLNMPTEVMDPLSQGMQALSENLLTKEVAE